MTDDPMSSDDDGRLYGSFTTLGSTIAQFYQNECTIFTIFGSTDYSAQAIKYCTSLCIKLHYITLSYYVVYASLLSLLQLFFCLHVRLLYAIKYYLLTYLLETK